MKDLKIMSHVNPIDSYVDSVLIQKIEQNIYAAFKIKIEFNKDI